MRIAIISTMSGFPWGGSEELWAAMASEALRQRHEVAVSIYHRPSRHGRINALEQSGARIMTRRLPKHLRVDRLAATVRPPFKELFAFKPDVVCISQGATYDAALLPNFSSPLKPLYEAALPYVVVCQFNVDEHVPTQRVREKAVAFFSRANHVGFVSAHNLRTTERHLARDIPNASVVRNPVNLSDLTAVPWPQSEVGGTVYMASMARLEVLWKGQDILLEALAAPVWRSQDWRLSLCGEGPDREYLEALARYYGIADKVDFLGHVRDVRRIWAKHQLLVLPSRGEGTPLALVEAMLCGRPAVATDVGGNAEWLEEGSTGFIATAPTATLFGDALQRAWATRAQWQEMGARAHSTAAGRIDPSPGQSLLKIVLDAASARAPRTASP